MPMPTAPDATATKQGALAYARAWGENAFPATLLASLITAQHFRPFQTLPMLFPPILLFSSYLNVQGFRKDSAGLTSAWSTAYLVLALRRRQYMRSRFSVRGVVRGATIGLCAANALAGGWAYFVGGREEERREG